MSNTYQPESLHPYIMNDRLKKATGSGGITNIPIASADTVGGIMIGGSANPITITGSGNASVRKATAELLGVVKVGAGVSVDADGAISGVAYSTTEHKTGRKWKDGKDIFEKTVILENTEIVRDSTFNIIESTGIDNVFSASFLAESQHGGGMLYTWIADGYVKTKSFVGYSSGTVNITIQYTKTN